MMELFDKQVLESIGKALLKKKETIAVAESVTSGLLQLALASGENASQFFQGGSTVYNAGQKYRQLGVEPIHALSVDSVSPQVSAQMSMGIGQAFCSDWGIGITGYATPVKESAFKLYAYYAIQYKGKIKKEGKIISKAEKPIVAQIHYVAKVLEYLRRSI